MPFNARIHRIMIASPSDVEVERDFAVEVIHKWNDQHSEKNKIVLLPVRWETHSAPRLGAPAQEIINADVGEKCDYLIGIFWHKFGTPTGNFQSGTLEEIVRHTESGKTASLYFSTGNIPGDHDPDEYDKVKKFKKQVESGEKHQGLYREYSSPDDFRSKFTVDLQILVNNGHFPSLKEKPTISKDEGLLFKDGSIDSGSPESIEKSLSKEAKEMLTEASKCCLQAIEKIETHAGTYLRAGKTTFNEIEDPRSTARWKAALKELDTNELVVCEYDKDALFEITDLGFRVVDLLTKN